jgi:hypothetical protein
MVRFFFVYISAALLSVLLAETVSAFQVGSRRLPVTVAATTGVRILPPANTMSKLFQGYSPSLQATSELKNDGDKLKKTALSTRVRKFIMALFRILLAPLVSTYH